MWAMEGEDAAGSMTIPLIRGAAVETRPLAHRNVLNRRGVLGAPRFCMMVEKQRVFGMHGLRGYSRCECTRDKRQLVDERVFQKFLVVSAVASGELGAVEDSCDSAGDIGRGGLRELHGDGTEYGNCNRFLEN